MDEKEYDDFVAKLQEDFPKMYGKPYGGICVGKGWWPIIRALSAGIQHHVDWKQQQKEKYNQGDGCPDVVVAQVKEKFGGLRFYYDGGNEYVQGMVTMAEMWASRTCEECGQPGQRRGGGWIRTLCDEHEEKRQQAYKERMENVQP